MPRDSLTQNFLYGDHSHKSRQSSVWGCKRSGSSPTNTHATRGSPKSDPTVDSNGITRYNATQNARQDNRRRPAKPSQDHLQSPRDAVRLRFSEPHRPDHDSPRMSPSQPQPLTMYPFRRLSTTVKQCPWMLGSDINPLASGHNPDFYFPVPRSMKHDTAVSFVVTDQTLPEQPQFVISCALEHVDLVRGLLAPAGSQRTLSARGSSGHPRDGAELRSMLLDGTPNIELALHKKTDATVNGSAGATDGRDGRHQLEGGGSRADRRQSFVRERPLEPALRDQSQGQASRPQEGRAPQGSAAPLMPAVLLPQGWFGAPDYQELRMERAAPAFVNPTYPHQSMPSSQPHW